ncbi:MAG: SlyX family protein [bacterium]|nr:SlyX family protein [Gammaproteobacteria bacterium]HIL99283.1 SlyX family protein [Pseudomonadales bacterium]
MSEDRFVTLETQLAFQEDMIQKLDDALAEQQKQILDIKVQLKYANSQIEAMEGQMPDQQAPEPPPPHY